MPDKPVIVPGVVRGGVVHPEGDATLPEGSHVEIILAAAPPAPPPPQQGNEDGATAADQWEREE
jgi:hypothetical protein